MHKNFIENVRIDYTNVKFITLPKKINKLS